MWDVTAMSPTFWPLVAAGLSALGVLLLQQILLMLWPLLQRRRRRGRGRYLAAGAGQDLLQRARMGLGGSDMPMELHPQAVVLSSLGLPVWVKLIHIRLLAGAWPLVGLVAGLPLVVVGAVCIISFVMVHSWLSNRWTQFVVQLESELAPFIGRLHNTLTLVDSVPLALSRASDALDAKSPLRAWVDRLATGVESAGVPFLMAALPAAQTLSPALGLMVVQLERAAQAGGQIHAQAFLSASEQLGTVLEMRATAAAKAAKIRGSITIFLAVMAVIAAGMMAQPTMREGFQHPITQLGILGSVILMVIGYLIIQAVARDALMQ